MTYALIYVLIKLIKQADHLAQHYDIINLVTKQKTMQKYKITFVVYYNDETFDIRYGSAFHKAKDLSSAIRTFDTQYCIIAAIPV